MIHELKTEKKYFDKLWGGSEPFGVRESGREFKEGDRLLLLNYSKQIAKYLGDYIVAYVTYILDDEFPGLDTGYVVMGLHIECKYDAARGGQKE